MRPAWLVRVAPYAAGASLLLLFSLKLVDEAPARRSVLTLCRSFWDDWWPLMAFAELVSGVAVLVPATRAFGAFVGVVAMAAAADVSLVAGGLLRVSMKGCRCFGPLDAPWWAHFLAALAVIAPLYVTLQEETRRRRDSCAALRARARARPRPSAPRP